MIEERIIELTVPSSDNGSSFTSTERLDLIVRALGNSEYRRLENMPLAKVYCHRDFQNNRPAILVSSHIDSVYDEYFASIEGDEFLGTFDNSVCNAVIVELMLGSLLSPQVLVSFTGDEESGSLGADQTITILQNADIIDRLEMVITMDITEEHYGTSPSTIENYFAEEDNETSMLKFEGEGGLREYLSKMLDKPVFIDEAEADESWQYDEYDLNCFSLCLPCRLLGRDMHSDTGVAILRDSVKAYMKALQQLCQGIDKDMTNKAV